MFFAKRARITLLIITIVQTISFYAIGEKVIVYEIGRNYESYVLQHNEFRDIGIISKLNPTKEQVLESFTVFKPYNVKVCISESDCFSLKETDFYYFYLFDFEIKTPFTINSMFEAELAKDYGATWESKYIWFFYKWILIEKTNTGIS